MFIGINACLYTPVVSLAVATGVASFPPTVARYTPVGLCNFCARLYRSARPLGTAPPRTRMSSPRWRARCRAVLPTLHLGNPMSLSLLLISLLSRQISATMMSKTAERGAPSTGPSNEWNDDDDGHANDADADGSYGSHVPGMGRRLLSNAEFYARYRESGQLNGAEYSGAGYSGPVEQPALAPRANRRASAPQPVATRSSQTLAQLANRKCVALVRFSSKAATATRCVHSDPDELAAVRCCGSVGSCYSVCGSPNGLARAVRNMTVPQATPFILDEVTCGIDSRLSTRAEASAECLAQGLQLCTLAEYKGCRRRGCDYDATWAWVLDECPTCTRGLNSQTRSRAPPARNCDGRNAVTGLVGLPRRSTAHTVTRSTAFSATVATSTCKTRCCAPPQLPPRPPSPFTCLPLEHSMEQTSSERRASLGSTLVAAPSTDGSCNRESTLQLDGVCVHCLRPLPVV